MSYHFQPRAGINDAVRQVAVSQLERGLAEIDDAALSRDETIHQVRKRCKKLRGLVRLVRPALGKDYDRENKAFRDTARTLSDARDAGSMINTYDELMEQFADQIRRSAFGSVRRRLTLRRQAIEDHVLDTRLANVRDKFTAALDRAKRWKLSESDFDAIYGGIVKTHSRACDRLADALESDTDCDARTDVLHELRKRTKYHWYHLRLLRSVWPAITLPYIKLLDDLGDLLGDDHDLAMLRQTVAADPGEFGDAADIQALYGLIQQRRTTLQTAALRQAQRMFAEPSKAFARRLEAYWTIARSEPTAVSTAA